MNKTLCSLLLAMTAGAASADTITVCLDGGCDHTDIQSALDAAENHDVIDIAAGTYHPSDTITLTTRVIRLRGAVDDQGARGMWRFEPGGSSAKRSGRWPEGAGAHGLVARRG